nr:MAG TPA: tail length tape measure protein [Caudoviricetes sp.]
MAKGNKLEILLGIRTEDNAINKLRQRMKSVFPVAENLEKKVNIIGKDVQTSGIDKLKNRMSNVGGELGKIKNKISQAFNARMFSFANKLNSNGVTNFVNATSKIPIVGRKISSVFSGAISKISQMAYSGTTLSTVFGKVGGAVKKAFKAENLKKFASALKGIGNKIGGILSKLGGLIGKLAVLGGIAGGLSFGGIAKASDENSLRNSRLSMVTKDVEGLKQKTFNASQQSGADYGAQLDSVAKLKMLTNGLFNDNEAVKFTSTLDKAFKVSGTSAEEAKSAMFQLNQAMTSGKLQGDEFRSVMENAPILAQKIAESMGVSMGQLKKLGSDGKITSDVIKKAVLGSADDIEAKYNQMPLTFGKVWQQAQNAGQQAMDGLLTKVNQMLNTPLGQKMAQDLQGAFTGFAGMANSALDGIVNIFGKLNFSSLLTSLTQLGTTIGQIFNNNMGGGKNFIDGLAGGLNGIISLAGTIAGVINGALQGINFAQVGQIIGNIGNAFSTLFQTIDFGSIGNLFGMTFNIIMQALTMITPLLAPIMQTIGMIFNFVVQIATAIMPIVGVIIQVGAVLLGIIVPVVQVVIGIFIGMSSTIIGVFSAIIGVVASIMSGILGVVSGVINAIGGVINQIAVFFTNAFNKAKSVAQSAINSIKGFIDGLFGKIGELGGKISNAVSKFNIFKGFGIGKSYIGAKSWRGGLTTVAEKGAEMVKLPGGQQFLAGQEMLMNLPQGTEISTAEATRGMLEEGLGGIKKATGTKGNTATTNNSTTNKGNNKIVFSPTIVIKSTEGNDNELENKIKRVLREFFEDSFAMMGG